MILGSFQDVFLKIYQIAQDLDITFSLRDSYSFRDDEEKMM